MASLKKFPVVYGALLAAAAILALLALYSSRATPSVSAEHPVDAAFVDTAPRVATTVEPAPTRPKATPPHRSAAVATLDLRDAREVASHFDELKVAALNGDSSAAQALHLALDNCRGAPRQAPAASGPINSRTAVARYKFENCAFFDPQQLAFDATLLHHMAERGDNLGRVAYYRTGSAGLDPAAPDYAESFSNYATDSLRYLQDAASEGDGDALWALGDAYSDGRIVAADSTRANAYRLSWQYLQDNPAGAPLDMDRLLNLAETQLGRDVDSGQEARIAQMAAEDILKFRGHR